VVSLPEISPHDLDAERAVLGAVLVNNAALVAVERIVQAADFFREVQRSSVPGDARVTTAAAPRRQRGDNVDTSSAAHVSRDRAYDAASR
jgi:NAD(P)-dependent dehydrogenase (short-subunit alcohol dehydrogenase family)